MVWEMKDTGYDDCSPVEEEKSRHRLPVCYSGIPNL